MSCSRLQLLRWFAHLPCRTTVICVLCFIATPISQAQTVPLGVLNYDAPPYASLATDKSVYAQFEPILVNVSITNTSATMQEYGRIRFPNHPSAIYYTLRTPSGWRTSAHKLYASETGPFFSTTSFQPGETREATLILPLIFQTMAEAGTYVLEVLFQPDHGLWVLAEPPLTTLSFDVVPSSTSPALTDAVEEASCLVLSRSSCDDDGRSIDEALELLDQVLVAPALPLHMREWALLLRALYLDQQYADERAPNSEIQAAYDAFLTEFPDSPYAVAAGYGISGIRDFGGLEPDDIPSLPDLTTLPAAASITSSTVTASFSGNSFGISGFDHDLSGNTTSSGVDRHGIVATDEAARQSILGELSSNQEDNITGQGTAPDVAVTALGLDVEALIDLLLARPDLITLNPDPGNQTIGSTSAPAIAYAPDGLDAKGNFEGTGILIVDGTFEDTLELRGNAAWTGLVIVRGQNGAEAQFDMSGSVEVVGALILVSDTGAVLDIGGSSTIRFSMVALQLAQTLLDAP